ncbi:uncharacterized protein LOC110914452 [Helianthus annuus]|uniref:uncharacterized protein LOC110914452 n=1 Tax=Helianthus annuus TaxID=4232 RepID=UPI000B903116|nr:uncharacterized protein LOC110914452 [Helianthus annuus]
MSEYLKLKARQADIRARIECKDQGDKAISERMEFLLTKVKQMEDYAKDLSKDMSNMPPDAALQEVMRKEFLEFIMKEKFYSAKEEQFSEWPLIALKHEVNMIKRIKNDTSKKRTAPNWSKYKQAINKLTSEYKRKKEELVDVKELKRRKMTDPNLPKKPEHKEPKQVIDPKPLFTSADTPILVINQEKGKLLTNEEEKEKETEYFTEAIKKMDLKEDSSAKLQNLVKKVLSKPASPNTSADMTAIELDQKKRQELIEKETAEDIAIANDVINMAFKQMSAESSQVFTRPISSNSSVNKPLPRNPLGSKVLKWMCRIEFGPV